MTEYPTNWRRETIEEALESVGTFGLYPDELTHLTESMPGAPNGNMIHASTTLREAGTILMVAAIGHRNDWFWPGIYVTNAYNEDALRWFNSRRDAAAYYDCLVAANA